MSLLEIDGSHGEGGGQLARYAVALAAITGRSVWLKNIRSKRAKPGLMAQHLTALRAVAAVCNGVLEEAVPGAETIRFQPGRIAGGEYDFDVGTAGSITLVLQALLPVVLRADSACRLHITGGTDVKMAPPVDYFRLVFLPWLARMGAHVRIDSVRHGYYPRGGGKISLTVHPGRHLNPLVAEHPGRLRAIHGVVHVAHLPLHIPERMAAAARSALADFAPVTIETRVLGDDEATGQGGALVLVAETEHSLLGSATVALRGVPAERLGGDAGQALCAELESGAALDIHASDQLLVYTALAKGSSRFTVRELSLHAQTLMWLIEQFLPVRFQVEARRGLHHIEVSGS